MRKNSQSPDLSERFDTSISTHAGNISVLQTTVSNLSPGGPDSTDGVEITFFQEIQFYGTPALELNGTNLVISQTDPTVTLGGQACIVLSTADIPNTNPSLQQVIVNLPGPIQAGYHKLKLTNTQGNSEVSTLLSDIAESTWAQATASAAFSVRSHHTSHIYDNKIWVIGGYTGSGRCDGSSVCSDIWSSTDGINWTLATDRAPWGDRYLQTSIVYDNKMWVIGGYGGGYKNDVWSSTNGINWTQVTASAPWTARLRNTFIVYDNKMWVIRGSGSDGTSFNDVWSSTDGITWTQVTASAAWTARRGHSSVVYDNKMWVIGGYGDGYEGVYGDLYGLGHRKDVWSSADGITWTQVTAFAAWTARYTHSSIVYDNKIWVIGGWATDGYKNDVWHLSPTP